MIMLIGAAVAIWLAWWRPFDECRRYSDFTCSQIDVAEYNVEIYLPYSDKFINLGHAKGLEQCLLVVASDWVATLLLRSTALPPCTPPY